MRKIIFVCHGNICRSVAAEYIAKQIIKEQNIHDIEVISRATSREEIGNDIYPPMKKALIRHGIEFGPHQARQITQEDYEWADEIYFMDRNNLNYLSYLLDNHKKIIYPISKYSPSIQEIDDPWYTGEYDLVINQLQTCINDILKDD